MGSSTSGDEMKELKRDVMLLEVSNAIHIVFSIALFCKNLHFYGKHTT